MKEIYEALENVNPDDQKTFALTFAKRTFGKLFEKETGIELAKHVKPDAFTSNELTFDSFTEMLSFIHFTVKGKSEVKVDHDSDGIEIFAAVEAGIAKSVDTVVGLRKKFDAAVLESISYIIDCLGHEARVIEVQDREAFQQQMDELKSEADPNA